MAVPRAHLYILSSFAEAGGSARLDPHGRVTAGTLLNSTPHPLPGDPTAWLVLVAAGLIGGEDGRLILTELGRTTAADLAKAQVREAS